MIPRLGDGNVIPSCLVVLHQCLENDSPSRGRKPLFKGITGIAKLSLENDSPSRGRKR